MLALPVPLDPWSCLSAQFCGQLPPKRGAFPPNLFSFTFSRTLLRSTKTQLLSFQAIPHSLPKTPGVGVPHHLGMPKGRIGRGEVRPHTYKGWRREGPAKT